MVSPVQSYLYLLLVSIVFTTVLAFFAFFAGEHHLYERRAEHHRQHHRARKHHGRTDVCIFCSLVVWCVLCGMCCVVYVVWCVVDVVSLFLLCMWYTFFPFAMARIGFLLFFQNFNSPLQIGYIDWSCFEMCVLTYLSLRSFFTYLMLIGVFSLVGFGAFKLLASKVKS